MKKLALALSVAAAFTGSAIAADLPARPYTKAPPPPVAAVASWTGCYVGAGGGYGMWDQENTLFRSTAPRDQLTDTFTAGGRGYFGTVQGGCDYQFGVGSQVHHRCLRRLRLLELQGQGGSARDRHRWRREDELGLVGRRPRRLGRRTQVPHLFQRRLYRGDLRSSQLHRDWWTSLWCAGSDSFRTGRLTGAISSAPAMNTRSAFCPACSGKRNTGSRSSTPRPIRSVTS